MIGQTMNAAAMRKHVHAIDLLRLAAAVAVVGHHWWWVTPLEVKAGTLYPDLLFRHAGYFGVSLFFMISGFVILMSAQACASAREFVFARVVRLYPAFWVCCTLTWLARLDQPMGPSFQEYLVNLTMFPLSSGVQTVDGVYWTLLLEAKFYLLIAVLMSLGRLHQIQSALWAWLALSCIAPGPAVRHLVIAEYAPYFVAGCTLFLQRSGRSAALHALLGAAFACAMYQGYGHALADEGKPAFVLVGIVVIFGVMLAATREQLPIPGTRAVVLAGAMSYPIYLLHKEIGYAVFRVGAIEHWPFGIAFLAAAALIGGLAWLIAAHVEKPMQGILRRALTPKHRWNRAKAVTSNLTWTAAERATGPHRSER